MFMAIRLQFRFLQVLNPVTAEKQFISFKKIFPDPTNSDRIFNWTSMFFRILCGYLRMADLLVNIDNIGNHV